MTGQVLHLDFIALAEPADEAARRRLIEEASKLTTLDEVVSVGVIESENGSDFDIVFFFVLPDFEALEPFGTNERYARFLQGAVAPVLRAFACADVRLAGDFPAPSNYAACLALTAPDETYDWEVRDALAAWTQRLSRRCEAIGLAVGERQRYRGVAIVFGDEAQTAERPEDGRFGVTLVSGRARTLS